eukprot:4638979-Prymnesium_polylepis.3
MAAALPWLVDAMMRRRESSSDGGELTNRGLEQGRGHARRACDHENGAFLPSTAYRMARLHRASVESSSYNTLPPRDRVLRT